MAVLFGDEVVASHGMTGRAAGSAASRAEPPLLSWWKSPWFRLGAVHVTRFQPRLVPMSHVGSQANDEEGEALRGPKFVRASRGRLPPSNQAENSTCQGGPGRRCFVATEPWKMVLPGVTGASPVVDVLLLLLFYLINTPLKWAFRAFVELLTNIYNNS